MPSHRYPRDLFGEVGVPDLGMDTDTVPRLMSTRKAQLVKNFLMDRPGVLPMRGPLCESTAWNAFAGIAPVGQWVFDDKVLISRYGGTLVAPNLISLARAGGGSLSGPLYYKVTALNGGGETTASNELSILASPGSAQITVTWSAVPGATGYRVYRGTSSGGENVFYAPGLVTSFVDTGAAGTGGTPPSTSTATTGATRDTWTAPYRKTATAGQLRALQLTSKLVDVFNNSAADVTAGTADVVPGPRSVRVGSFVYGHGGDATATVTQLGALYKKTKFLKWDGAATGPAAYTHGTQAAQDITSHYNRLFVLGGIVEGGTAIQFNTLSWSDQLPTDGTALPDTAAAWQDDVSGLVNQLVVGSDDSSDFGVALAHVGTNLCIFKRRSMWMLYGNQPANFSVKQASNEVGCIDPRSVVEYNGGVYFMSDRGCMFYDGTRIQNVSVGLNNSLVANARKQCGAAGVDGGYVRASKLGAGYILVATGVVDGNTGAATADTDAWLLYAPNGAWTQLSSGALTAVVGAGQTVNYPYLLTDQRVVRASYLFSPSGAPANTRGMDSVDGYLTSFIIPSRWTTRALELSAPTSKSKLQRIMAEYYWSLANGGWTVTTTTRGATGVASSASVVAAPTTVGVTLPVRASIPIFNETDEVYLDVAATSSAPAAFNDAELHRLLLEYEPTGNTVPV